MSRRRHWTLRASAALCALLVGGMLAVRAAVHALMLEPLPDTHRTVAPEPREWHPPGDATPAPRLIQSAIDHDVFRRERKRAPDRFRLPGEGVPAQAPTPPVTPTLTLVGTAVTGDGKGFAMCQRPGELAKLVRVGERYGDVTLREVAPGRALFRSKDGSTMELRVTKAGT